MPRSGYTFALVLSTLLLLPAAARAQQSSSCVACHFANDPAPASGHLGDWDRSAHSVNRVGCEACHGGNAGTDSLGAHGGILSSSNPTSPLNRRNLPATCGTCHTGQLAAFQKSRHFAMLNTGDSRVPACTTCHGAVGSRVLSAKALEGQCQQCHGPNGVAPSPGRAAAARTLLEGINEVRGLLNSARPSINRISDKARQTQLQAASQLAEAPVIESARSIHEFIFDTSRERLVTARQRIEALFAQIVNPR